MAKRATYSDDQKAAVMAALLAGQSISQVAAEYKIPTGTVKKWSAGMAEQRAEAAQEPGGTTKRNIGDLLLDYVEANLRALRAQADIFTDREWLLTQSASDAAVLHGVMTDKAVRLLEAMGGAAAEGPSAS